MRSDISLRAGLGALVLGASFMGNAEAKPAPMSAEPKPLPSANAIANFTKTEDVIWAVPVSMCLSGTGGSAVVMTMQISARDEIGSGPLPSAEQYNQLLDDLEKESKAGFSQNVGPRLSLEAQTGNIDEKIQNPASAVVRFVRAEMEATINRAIFFNGLSGMNVYAGDQKVEMNRETDLFKYCRDWERRNRIYQIYK